MNTMTKAIQNFRKKKMGEFDMSDPETQELAMEEGEAANADAERETSLAPSLKNKAPMASEVDDQEYQDAGGTNGMGLPNRQEEMAMQNMGSDQGDAMDREALLKSLYQDGDENRKGFLGKAAGKIKEGLAKVRG